jgi:hypothetical protein
MNAAAFPQLGEVHGTLGAPLIADISDDIAASFEFFPPKTKRTEIALWDTVQTLATLTLHKF